MIEKEKLKNYTRKTSNNDEILVETNDFESDKRTNLVETNVEWTIEKLVEIDTWTTSNLVDIRKS